MRHVEQPGPRRERRRAASPSRRARPGRCRGRRVPCSRLLLLDRDQPAGLQVDAAARGDVHERRSPRAPRRSCGRSRTCSRCDRRGRAPCACVPFMSQVEQHVLVDAVVVEQVVRAPLVEPACFAGVGVAGEDAGGPLVVAGTLIRVPRARVGGAVEDQIRARGRTRSSPTPCRRRSPGFGRPRRDAEVRAAILRRTA